MTGLGVLSLTVLFHRKGHPGLDLKSNSSSNIIYPFVCCVMFQVFCFFFPGVMGEGAYVEV